jgi:hypothetical protein
VNLSRGAVALKNCGKDFPTIAKIIGSSASVVHNWMRGHRTPGDKFRGVLEEKFGISRAMWDEPAAAALPSGLLDKLQSPAPVAQAERAPDCTGEVPSSSLGGGPIDPRGEAEALVAHVRRYRLEAENNPTLSPTERAKVLETASRSVERLYRLTGEAATIPESRILASPAWGRVKDAIAAALEPHPEALRAVTAALEELAR